MPIRPVWETVLLLMKMQLMALNWEQVKNPEFLLLKLSV